LLGSGLALPPWAGLVVVLFGLLFLIVGGTTLVAARRRRRTWVPRTGRVVGSRPDGDGHLRLQIAFIEGDREITFWNRFTSSLGVDPVGREVDVLANPADPSDAVVVRGAAQPSLVGWVFVVFGVVATVVGLVLTV